MLESDYYHDEQDGEAGRSNDNLVVDEYHGDREGITG